MGERSPNYPAVGLEDAISLCKSLYLKEKRTAVPIDVIAKAWGYTSVSGPVRSKLSALKKYGLVDDDPNGWRLSTRAIDIVTYGTDTQEYRRAIRDAALEPDVFRELQENHEHASDDALRSYLIARKGFSQAGAKSLIKAFRETSSVAKLDDPAYSPNQSQPKLGQEGAPMLNAPQPPQQLSTLPGGAKTAVSTIFPLPGGNSIEIRMGRKVTTSEYESALEPLFKLLKVVVIDDKKEGE